MIQALLVEAAGSITQRGGVALIAPRRPLSQAVLTDHSRKPLPAPQALVIARGLLQALADVWRYAGAFHGFLQSADRFALVTASIDAALYSSPSAPSGNGAEGGEAPIESESVW